MADTLGRQFVNYRFLQLDLAWRHHSEAERASAKLEYAAVLDSFRHEVRVFSYSTVGMRGDCDMMLWCISDSPETFQRLHAALNGTALGKFLTAPHSYLAMTRKSEYVDNHAHPGQEGLRLRIRPTEMRYLFVYPFVKTRTWYLLPKEERQRMMDEHIRVGHEYPSVKLNTTYSFGLDDQDFVVAFETNQPGDFLDLVMALRYTDSSMHTARDVPIFTCIRRPLGEVLDLLDGTGVAVPTPLPAPVG